MASYGLQDLRTLETKQETPTESAEGSAIARKEQEPITQISRACKGARRYVRLKSQLH